MTQLYYGGEPGSKPGDPGMVDFDQVRTLHYSRQAVLDGPTRLYDLVDYEGVGYLNPSVISYIRGAGGVPLAAPGQLPAVTDDAIRAYLLEPRRQLILKVGNDTLLSSPHAGFMTDAANGPKPFCCDVTQISGIKTMIVRFGVRTFVNPCHATLTDTSVTLSHRWGQERVTDVDGMATLTTRGKAIFDTGKLLKLGVVPDDFWATLTHPLPVGFQRAHIQVAQNEDNTELHYVIIDREMPMVLANTLGISRIEATHSASIVRGSVFEAMKKEGKEGATMGAGAGGIAGAKIGSLFLPGIGTAIGGTIGAIGGWIGGGLIGTAVGTVPLMTHNISVRLWGQRFTTKKTLENTGRRIVLSLLLDSGVTTLAKKVAGYTNTIVRDVAGRFVEVHGLFVLPTLWAALDTAEKGFGFGDELWPNTPASDEITVKDVKQTGFLGFEERKVLEITNRVIPNVTLPFDGRGYWLGQLAAQALTRTCQLQPKPPVLKTARQTLEDKGGI